MKPDLDRLKIKQAPSKGLTRGQTGSVIVIAMMFVMVFLILGVALYWLISSQTRSTELERTDVKAFNVAEAGIDTGMLALKLAWPSQAEDVVSLDPAVLKQTIKEGTTGLWDPTRHPGEFLDVVVYDNIDPVTGETDAVPHPDAPIWDSNGDGMMFVDSTANVDNDRHRILILAERQAWVLSFPTKLALWANVVDSNGQGLEVKIENGTPPVEYDVHDAQHKGVDPGPGVQQTANPTAWEDIMTNALRTGLEGIARQQGSYFEGPNAASEAEDFLATSLSRGTVVYVKANSAVTIGGDNQIGTEDEPVVVILDTPDGSENTWDMRGTADFYGILVSLGDSTLRGTCGIHGAMYCKYILSNKGDGSSGEINYNQKVIDNINGQYVISVNIVPNTWEEYTLPRSSTTSPAGG